MLALLRRFTPPRPCVFCGLDAGDSRVCIRCLRLLPGNDCCCVICGQPVTVVQPVAVPCADCQRQRPPVERARTLFRYAFPVDVALKAIKFRRQLAYAPVFAAMLLPLIETVFHDCDALVPVPLHRWRRVRRGFNQAGELCTWLARRTLLPVEQTVIRSRRTAPQTGLSGAARRRNLHGAFACRGKLRSRHPLIVDDVITTGATSNELARTLLVAGAEKVSVIAVAHAAQSFRSIASATQQKGH